MRLKRKQKFFMRSNEVKNNLPACVTAWGLDTGSHTIEKLSALHEVFTEYSLNIIYKYFEKLVSFCQMSGRSNLKGFNKYQYLWHVLCFFMSTQDLGTCNRHTTYATYMEEYHKTALFCTMHICCMRCGTLSCPHVLQSGRIIVLA